MAITILIIFVQPSITNSIESSKHNKKRIVFCLQWGRGGGGVVAASIFTMKNKKKRKFPLVQLMF